MEPGYPLPTLLQTSLSIVAFFFPLMLLAVWVALAFVDLGTRTDLSTGQRFGWSAAVLAVPWIGAAAYHLAGRSGIAGSVRAAMIGGGVVIYLALLALGRLVGGIA